MPTTGRTVTATSTQRRPGPDISGYAFLGTVMVQTN